MEQSKDALFLIRVDGVRSDKATVCYANQAAADLTGFSRSLLTEMDCNDLLENALSSLPHSDCVEIKLSDGTTRCCQATFTTVRHAQEDCLLLTVTAQALRFVSDDSVGTSIGHIANSANSPNVDRQVNRTLDAKHFRELLDQIGAIVWEANLPFQGITYISAQLTSVLGYSVEDWLSDPNSWENSILEEDRLATVMYCKERSSLGEDHVMEYRAITADGRIVWIDDRINVIKDENGTPIMLRGVMIDITESKLADEAFRLHQVQHQLLIDHAPVCIHSIDCDGRLESINPKGMGLVGASSADEVIGSLYMDFVDDVDHQRISDLLKQACEGVASHYEFVCKTNHGPRTFKSNFIPIGDQNGHVKKIIGTSEDVTDTNRTFEKLRIQERAIDAARSGIMIVDIQNDPFRLIHCNPAFEAITGYSRDTVIGTDGSQLVIDDSGLTLAQFLRATVHSDQSDSVVKRQVGSDGALRHCEVSVSMVRDANDQISHLVCLFTYITDRVIIESQLRQSEHLFRTLSVHSPNGVLLCDVQGSLSYINDRGARILGRPAQDCLGDRWRESIHPKDSAHLQVAFERLLEFGDSFSVEAIVNHQSRQPTSVLVRLNPRKSDDGQVLGYVGSIVDITQRKRDLELLAQNERRFRAMVENAPEAIIIYDFDKDSFEDWNENAVKLFGFNNDDDFGQAKLSQLVPTLQPDGTESIVLARRSLVKVLAGENLTLECMCVDLNGKQFPSEIRLVKHSDFRPRLVRASVTDVTVRRATDEKMLRIRIALENTSDAFFAFDSDGSVIDVNKTTCKKLGYSRTKLLSMNVKDFDVGLNAQNWPDLWNAVKDRGSYTVEAEYRRKNGSCFPVEVSASYSDSGQEIVVALARDTTERKQADAQIRERESQLAHVSRRSTMGELVAGIAHEVNQPLYSIMNFAKATNVQLSKIIDPNESDQHINEFGWSEIARWNEQIVQAASNAGNIVHRMGAFFAQSSSVEVPSQVDSAIMDVTDLIAHELRRANVELQLQLDAPNTTVVLDRIEIQQIVVNLIINSIEAIDQNDDSQRKITVQTYVDGQHVVAKVIDTGPGFSKIPNGEFFEAFSTTKQNSMGMGLAVVNTLIQKCDGKLTVSESQSEGAVVTFSIPIYCGPVDV
ncbi:MAG: PAS domain S-box protein [Pirellulaceae bacterium]